MSIVVEIECMGTEDQRLSVKSIEFHRDGLFEFLDYDIDADETEFDLTGQPTECFGYVQAIEDDVIAFLLNKKVLMEDGDIWISYRYMLDCIEHSTEPWLVVDEWFGLLIELVKMLRMYVASPSLELYNDIKRKMHYINKEEDFAIFELGSAAMIAADRLSYALNASIGYLTSQEFKYDIENHTLATLLLTLREVVGLVALNRLGLPRNYLKDHPGEADAKDDEYMWQLSRLFDYAEGEP